MSGTSMGRPHPLPMGVREGEARGDPQPDRHPCTLHARAVLGRAERLLAACKRAERTGDWGPVALWAEASRAHQPDGGIDGHPAIIAHRARREPRADTGEDAA